MSGTETTEPEFVDPRTSVDYPTGQRTMSEIMAVNEMWHTLWARWWGAGLSLEHARRRDTSPPVDWLLGR